jgi:hypothetical protein
MVHAHHGGLLIGPDGDAHDFEGLDGSYALGRAFEFRVGEEGEERLPDVGLAEHLARVEGPLAQGAEALQRRH